MQLVDRREETDHFMVGQRVSANGREGEIKTVIEYDYEDEDGRHTHKRVLVDAGDREVDCSTDDVEVIR